MTLELETHMLEQAVEDAAITLEPGILDRMLINLEMVRPAHQIQRRGWSVTNQFYWFKCQKCRKITATYRHGHSGFLPCSYCEHDRLSRSRELKRSRELEFVSSSN
jgi:ribosomal protein S27E